MDTTDYEKGFTAGYKEAVSKYEAVYGDRLRRLAEVDAALERMAALIPEQTIAMVNAGDRLKQAALDQGFFPGSRRTMTKRNTPC